MTAWVHLRAVAFRQTTTAAMTAAPLATQRAAAPTTRWAELVAATPRSSGAPPRPATTPPKRLLVVAGGPCPPRPTRRQPRVSDSRARLLCPLGPRRRPRGNAHRLWPGRRLPPAGGTVLPPPYGGEAPPPTHALHGPAHRTFCPAHTAAMTRERMAANAAATVLIRAQRKDARAWRQPSIGCPASRPRRGPARPSTQTPP